MLENNVFKSFKVKQYISFFKEKGFYLRGIAFHIAPEISALNYKLYFRLLDEK